MNSNSMREQWHRRYDCLKRDLAEADAANRLLVAESHWHALEKAMKGYSFISDEDEIYFFKTIKPLFAATLELYHLHKAGGENPLFRLKKFKEKHATFVNYYTGDSTENDREWFMHYSGLRSSKDHMAVQLLTLQLCQSQQEIYLRDRETDLAMTIVIVKYMLEV